MKLLIKYVLILTLFSTLAGPSVKIPFIPAPINIYLTDIFVILLQLLLILNFAKTLKIFRNSVFLKYFVAVNACFLLSFILNPISLNNFEKLVSVSYLLRYFAYISIYVAVIYLRQTEYKVENSLFTALFITTFCLAVSGWLQYLLYPDLRNLSYLGWDPHYKRIFALIFDPNYLGLMLVLGLITLFIINKKQALLIIIGEIALLITVAFTYSRSTFLALIGGAVFYFYRIQKLKLIYYAVPLFILLLFLLPRPGGVGVELERVFSITGRIQNWQNSFTLFSDHPFLGVGFNTLRFARNNYKYLPPDWLLSHSAAGVDNSFLFIAVTSGITGLAFFVFLLFNLWKNSGILGRTVIISTIIHSLFINSLFFNFVLIWFWYLTALDMRLGIKENS